MQSDGLQTQESCTQYNTLKIARTLFRWTGDPAVADFYERAFLNGVLGVQRHAPLPLSSRRPLPDQVRKFSLVGFQFRTSASVVIFVDANRLWVQGTNISRKSLGPISAERQSWQNLKRFWLKSTFAYWNAVPTGKIFSLSGNPSIAPKAS